MSEAAAVLTQATTEAPSAVPTPGGATPETPAAAGGASPPAEVKPSPAKSFAAAARREKALQRQRAELAHERAAIEAEKARIATARREAEALAAKPENPLKALERFGWSYKDATEFALNDSQPTAEQIARETQRQLEADRTERAQREKTAQEEHLKAQAAAVDATLQEFRGEITSFVKDNAKKYELVALQDATNLIYDVIELHHQKTLASGTPKVLSIDEAAALVEAHLEKQAEKLLGAGKIKAKLATRQQPDPKQPATSPGQVTAQPNRTLSNGMTPSTTPTLVSSAAIENDRMRRALAALGG